jgi:GntR family transcriptional regulator
VLRQEVGEASPEVARRLQLRRGEQVHLIVRLRFVDDEPMLISTTYVPFALCPDLASEDLTECSLYALLRDRYGLAIARGERRLEATAADAPQARLLDVALGSPLLLLDSVAYAADGRPFEHSVALQRGDRTTVEVEFLATPDDLALGSTPARSTERTAAELMADSLTGSP